MAAARGLFLDLDGTLADSLSNLRNVYEAFLAQFGIAASEAEFRSLNGPPLRRVVEILHETHRLPATGDALYARYLEMLAASHAHVAPAVGAEDVLSAAREKGWFVAVVTSTPHAEAQSWLDRVGLAPLIDGVVGGDDVRNGKPSPEPYLHALKLGNCAAFGSVAIEDSLQGATAACEAGIPTWLLAATIPQSLAKDARLRGTLPAFAAITELLAD